MGVFDSLHGALSAVAPWWALVLGIVLALFVFGFVGAPFWLWAAVALITLIGVGAPIWLIVLAAALSLVFLIPPFRRVLSLGVMKAMKAFDFLPVISETEQEAIHGGTVWVEGELFSGKPDFHKLLDEGYAGLSNKEQAFMDGPVEELCAMTNEWEVTQRRDLSAETWQYIKDQRFFGLMIPEEYGGHGFSPSANSAIVSKAASASSTLGITVMVPNSLGPAELLMHYGTDIQKEHYLPLLARGEEIPSFALTEPAAGSDAGAMTASGLVFKGDDGELYLRLNWNKRYITLAAISTLLGLAFKLRDPEDFLGRGEDRGITCALIPTTTPGVVLGKRHDPLGVPFWNCPTEGHDVVVKLEEAVIGGVEGVGKGWRMLMQSLAAGRGISLPASSTGGIKGAGRVASAHAVVRKQFGLPIGKFEGIEEPLARIGGWAYLTEAARRYTCGGLDSGAKPAVVTAIMKYNTTELFRKAVNDGMDILAGNGISRGPRNTLAQAYIGLPVSITVEGANILTRTLMIFGQGAIRCHPYALAEMEALTNWDVKAFDAAFWKHIGHVARNKVRSIVLSITRGRLASSPVSGVAAPYWRKIAWSSATFAFLADIAMGTLGGDLKRKEKLTGRFADIFSWMYLASATLVRFEAEGRRKEDEPFMRWSLEYALEQMQSGFDGLFENMRVPGLSWLMRGPGAAWSRFNRLSAGPSDELGHEVAAAMQIPGEQRDRIFGGIYVPSDIERPLGRYENAMTLAYESDGIAHKIRAAVKTGKISKASPAVMVEQALAAGVITSEEAKKMEVAETARMDAIQVDSFDVEDYFRSAVGVDTVGDGAISAAKASLATREN